MDHKTTIVYLVRHGQHKTNVLTPDGITNVLSAGFAIRGDLAGRGLDAQTLRVYSSQEPRAVQTGAIIAATIGCRVTGGTSDLLNPAQGLASAITDGRLPAIGQGFVKAWRARESSDVEAFEDVVFRGAQFLDSYTHVNGSPIIAATHGGVIEPTISIFGGDDHDFAEGEVVIVENYDPGAYRIVGYLNQPAR